MNAERELNFVLPDGYVDREGRRHRSGRMRCATARDEIRALGDFRVFLRPEAFLDVALSRVIERLGEIARIDVGIVERLSDRDHALLERLYRRQNGYSESNEEDGDSGGRERNGDRHGA